ncbi:MAG: hypothetical protein A4E71_03284 [Smithella sp. PtaU1.Bin162]|nr:MAG: hypothetical protein A4E71_03284 [Smithella sp. PtaU1.Bin162]
MQDKPGDHFGCINATLLRLAVYLCDFLFYDLVREIWNHFLSNTIAVFQGISLDCP